MTMEKLRTLRKQKGYTQQQIADLLATDVSNYSRKENGDVKIFDDEWEKLAKVLDVSVEDIKEDKEPNVVQKNENITFNDTSSFHQSGIYNCNVPNYLLENQQEYINLLKEQIKALKEENEKLKKG
ncbi:Helix-turn-helix domain [Chryseobacterium gleum]|uniref:Helix-turn-helix domain n=2 Tax=Chryseobacterium gleum TaxID=250 RepID=A0A3S5E2I4_CHRGE|nr:helix-turn-helix transcriptional regulator [Chryseobacterium gleum]EFK35292.1 DNA-binding helix-turn-helix protein [Chryseobacterium gleum ATCC 35910]QQY31076.1 helix-turn-helix transcriptional regulator [Chryseobacterium gleum]VEE04550.1 Helix-turn-helix domain [Chryseobacterium gleum]